MERPILFGAPMVRALLAGTKTQTRRLMKVQPPADVSEMEVGTYHPTVIHRDEEAPGPAIFGAWSSDGAWASPCRHGAPGDRLWVKETFQRFSDDGEIMYAADPASFEAMNELKRDDCPEARWRPSIFMPRWASRITLELTDVRVERLQDISQGDAVAEGAPPSHASIDAISREFGYEDFPRSWYAQLWEDINGAGGWAANPFVWVLSFRRV